MEEPTTGQESPVPAATPSSIDLHVFLGFRPTSQRLIVHLSKLAADASLEAAPTPEVKAFSDCVYYNLHALGISLVFHPVAGYKPKTGTSRADLQEDQLRLASIDVYNHEAAIDPPSSSSSKPSPSRPSTKPSFAAFPSYPIRISYPSNTIPSTPQTLLVDTKTVGKEFVSALGEPDRKGGGEGSMGIWTEWTGIGLMVEYASGGLQAWDKGGEATWKVLSVFERGVAAGKDDDQE